MKSFADYIGTNTSLARSDSELPNLKKEIQQTNKAKSKALKLSQSLIFYNPYRNLHNNFDKTFTTLATRQVITQRIYGFNVQRHKHLTKLVTKKTLLPLIESNYNSADEYYENRTTNCSPLSRYPTIPKVREDTLVIDFQTDGKFSYLTIP
jgi:hypothetical protein